MAWTSVDLAEPFGPWRKMSFWTRPARVKLETTR